MTKADLVDRVTAATGLTKRDVAVCHWLRAPHWPDGIRVHRGVLSLLPDERVLLDLSVMKNPKASDFRVTWCEAPTDFG